MVKPNFGMVPSKRGPVIDVFSFNRLPDGEYINAENKTLMDSGYAYWQMWVERYGCDVYNNVARQNANLFFSELWRREYYREVPEVGLYVALYKIFNKCGWCELSEKAMSVYLDSAWERLDGVYLWSYIMMYTSCCKGNYADAVQWLRKRIDKDKKPGGFFDKLFVDSGTALPLLRHYMVLLQIQKEVPFEEPALDGNLADYWKKIYDEYHCEEALLEYAFIKTVHGHNPFVAYDDDYPDCKDTETFKRPEIPYDILNSFAKKGNYLAFSVVSDKRWRFAEANADLPTESDILKPYNKTARSFGEDWFRDEFLLAKARAAAILGRKEPYITAVENYAAGIFSYALNEDEKARECMLLAAKQRDSLSGAFFYGEDFDPAESALCWLRRKAAEKKGTEEKFDINDMESLADGLNKSHSEIRLRKLGFLFRDGFKNLRAFPDYWQTLRNEAYNASKYGLVLFCLDDGEEAAESTFRSMTEKPEDWGHHTVTCAWLGLAYIRFLHNDFDGIKELLEFMKRDFAERNLFSDEEIAKFERRLKAEDISCCEELSGLFSNERKVNIGNLIMKDMGKTFLHAAERIYEKYAETYDEGTTFYFNDMLFGIGKDISEIIYNWVRFEMKHLDKQRLLGSALNFGLKYSVPYAYSLFAKDDIMEATGNLFTIRQRLDALYIAQGKGYDVAEPLRLLTLEKRRIDYEIYKATHKDEPSWKGSYDPNSSSSYDSGKDVDDFLDILERLGNEGGYTNKELYYVGERSAWDDMNDDLFRERVKDDYDNFWK